MEQTKKQVNENGTENGGVAMSCATEKTIEQEPKTKVIELNGCGIEREILRRFKDGEYDGLVDHVMDICPGVAYHTVIINGNIIMMRLVEEDDGTTTSQILRVYSTDIERIEFVLQFGWWLKDAAINSYRHLFKE